MNVLVTGTHGTLAPELVAALEAAGHTCVAWKRDAVDPNDEGACAAFLDQVQPDAVAHLALGAERWAAQLAAWCAGRERPFLYTSSAMVFGNEPDGPHRAGDERSGQDDYGKYKARCEDLVAAAYPGASLARIGWQIGLAPTGKNDMLTHLHATHEREGRIEASTRWVPACSFLVDTALALVALLEQPVAGVVHLDANAESAWTFFQLVQALRAGPGEPSWSVEPSESYVHDQRLLDDDPSHPRVAPLSARLSLPS